MIKTVAHNNYDGTWRIETSHGDFLLIDEADLDLAMRYSWSLNGRGYAHAHIDHKWVTLPRYLIGITDTHVIVDHINGNKLDNRRANLRVCTQQQNCMNRAIRSDNKSGCAGVFMRKNGFQVRVGTKYLGTFKTLEDAIRVRKAGEEEYFGEYSPAGRNVRITCLSVI